MSSQFFFGDVGGPPPLRETNFIYRRGERLKFHKSAAALGETQTIFTGLGRTAPGEPHPTRKKFQIQPGESPETPHVRGSTLGRINYFHIHGQNRARAALAGPQSFRGEGGVALGPVLQSVVGVFSRVGWEGGRGGVRLNLAAMVLGCLGATGACVGGLWGGRDPAGM